MVVVGVDACKDGWVAVVLRSGAVQAFFLETIDELNAAVPDAHVVAIDIPLGLLASGGRVADAEGRKELGRRSSTLFVVPARSALEASTHEEATRLSVELSGFGISRQSYSLRTKIFEVDRWLGETTASVYEVHPELSFKEMTGAVVVASKKTWSGMTRRREALLGQGINLDDVDDDIGQRAAVDDMLHAGAAAWTARRINQGQARALPSEPQFSPSGRQIVIWV
jgi:predicted RNase H-like nuclease